MNGASIDPKTSLGGGVSIEPGTNSDGAITNGDWVDCGDLSVSPKVSALCTTASATGSPTSYTVDFHIEEADDASGTNAQDCAVKSDGQATGDKQQVWATAQRTKQFCRVVADPTFTGGSSPTIDLGASILAQKYDAS